MLVADKIVVGDEKGLHSLGQILAKESFEIVRGAEAALASLHVDDGAEAARERAAASEIEARPVAPITPDRFRGQHGVRRGGDARQVREIIVDRLKLVLPCVDQQAVEAPFFAFAREERAADVQRRLDFRRYFFQHRQATRDMEAADHDRQPGRAKLAGQIEGVVELVRLDADQPDQRSSIAPLEVANDAGRNDMLVALVDRHQVDADIGTEHLARRAVAGETVQRRQGIGGKDGAPPNDRIAVVVIVRRLDHHEVEFLRFVVHCREPTCFIWPLQAETRSTGKMC